MFRNQGVDPGRLGSREADLEKGWSIGVGPQSFLGGEDTVLTDGEGSDNGECGNEENGGNPWEQGQ